MLDSLRLERVYPHPPEVVWLALTDPLALADWLMPNNFKPVVGHRFVFQIDPTPGCPEIVECEVLEVDRPRRLVWSWTPVFKHGKRPAEGPSTVVWTLEPVSDGRTRLVLTHEGLSRVYPWWLRLMLRFGWGTMVKRWIPKVAGGFDLDGTYTPGAIGSTRMRYRAKTVPDELIKAP